MLHKRYKYNKSNQEKIAGRNINKVLDFEKLFKLEPSNCMLCNSNDFTDILEIDRFGFYYPTGVCLNCGNIQQTKYLNEIDVNKFYKKYYRNFYGEEDPGHLFIRGINRRVIDFVNPHNLKIKNVLEVGTGSGGILKEFQDEGIHCLGIDYDLKYLKYGIDMGLDLIEGGIEEVPEGYKFDLIIIAHVLEHVKNPIIFLEKLKQKLNKNGFVYIEVPSLESVSKGVWDYDLRQYVEIAHTVHFTVSTLKQLLLLSGFEITKMDEHIRVVCKPTDQIKKIKTSSYNYSMSLLSEIELKRKRYTLLIRFKKTLIKFLGIIGLKKIIKKLYKK